MYVVEVVVDWLNKYIYFEVLKNVQIYLDIIYTIACVSVEEQLVHAISNTQYRGEMMIDRTRSVENLTDLNTMDQYKITITCILCGESRENWIEWVFQVAF